MKRMCLTHLIVAQINLSLGEVANHMARRGSSAGILVSQEVGVRQQAIVALQVDGYSFALVGVAQANVRRVKAVLKNGQNNREITLTR